jgi:predicted transcriptional regulator
MLMRRIEEKLSDSKSILSEGLGREVLANLVVGDELRIRRIQSDLSASYSRIKRVLDKLEAEDLVTHREIPHRNPGMPGTYVYATREELREHSKAILDLLEQARLDAQTVVSDTPAIQASDTNLAQRLQKIRPSSRTDHFKLVRLIAQSGPLTMNDLASTTGLRPQNVHSRLRRLVQLKVLVRIKEAAQEFNYHLARDITKDAVEAFGANIEPVRPPIQEVSTEMTRKPTSFHHEVSEQSKSFDLAKTLAEKMPSFDASWSPEVQEKWFASIESIERIAALGADQRPDDN